MKRTITVKVMTEKKRREKYVKSVRFTDEGYYNNSINCHFRKDN